MDQDLSMGLKIGAARHPAIRHFGPHFAYGHLPEHLQAVSARFAGLAQFLIDTQQDTPELAEAVRKLWESKNSAVLNAGFLAGQQVA